MNHQATESSLAIATRMDLQRAQLRRQFLHPPQVSLAQPDHAAENSQVMQPHEPRSFLMKLLKANPQLIQKFAMLAVTTALGARYSSWAMKLFGLFLATRKR